MKTNYPRISFFCLIFILLLSSCSLSVSQPTSIPTVKPQITDTQEILPTNTSVVESSPTPAVVDLSAEALQNIIYRLSSYGKVKDVQLLNGEYNSAAENDPISVRFIKPIVITDLNNDGLKDAAVLVAENYGGTGVFISLVVFLNQEGKAVQSDTILIDDRAEINSFDVVDGKLILEGKVHGVEDAMCCPTFAVKRTYQVTQDGLQLVSQSSKTASGDLREIVIESPADGAEVSGTVQVVGTVTISPFENNLVIIINDSQGNEISRGPFMVNSDGIGGPGTFDNPVDLSAISPGSTIRLSLSELSMADGSLLTMDSVELKIK
jgi:hypothetical protein